MFMALGLGCTANINEIPGATVIESELAAELGASFFIAAFLGSGSLLSTMQ